jgi:hypothetical protein
MAPDLEYSTPGFEQALEFQDPIDEMVNASFPASDPPSGWAGEDPRDVAPDSGDDIGAAD